MKIKLIAPHEPGEDGISSAETFKIQRLSLPLLAAMTPAEHEIRIIDEAFVPDDPKEDVDLVGITVLTDTVRRAYHLADLYRQRGAKVILGGIHATVLPMEALNHADAVVVGEGELVWPGLLRDVAAGKLSKIYKADRPVALDNLPRPRRDLYRLPLNKGYTPLAYAMETSRGCPYDCEFCSIHKITGRGYRMRPVREVIAEMESVDFSSFFFVDDSFGLIRNATKTLLREMIPLKCLWVGQGTISLAADPELVKLMRLSGCRALLIGFESVQKQIQAGMKKISGVKIDFSEAVRRFHGEGIAILGAFVFGSDNENKDIFDQTLEFSLKNRLDGLQLRILTPFPGTGLYDRLLKEGRLLEPQWWARGYSSAEILYRPKGMTAEELRRGFDRLVQQTYSGASIIRRFFGMGLRKRTSIGMKLYFGFNLGTRNRYLKNMRLIKSSASGREQNTDKTADTC